MSALVSPLELRSDGFIATLPESRGTDGFLTFMSFGYMILCSGASVAVVKTALVHNDDPAATGRHATGAIRYRLLSLNLTASSVPSPRRAVPTACSPS